jgi:dTDP-4-dehydrorhamnose reductase
LRVAVVGARGQLGSDLIRVFGERGHEVTGVSHQQVDVIEPSSIVAALAEIKPEAVINCAAYHRVDECEDRPRETLNANALGALNVARACEEIGAVCVFISSDYVFDGSKGDSYKEDDRTQPLNVYGVSKVAGEQFVAQTCERWAVMRVASLFGAAGASGKGGNFVETILTKAASGAPLRVVDDIYMSPTYTLDAAESLETLLGNGAHGLYHVTNSGSVSWYGFARKILDLTGVEADLQPTESKDWPTKARRPANSSLRTSRGYGGGSSVVRDWEDALKAYLSEKGHI